MRIAFFENHLTIRGSSVALYDYAHFNETILNNYSIIITRHYTTNPTNIDVSKKTYDKFNNRFPIFYIDEISDIQPILDSQSIDIIYIIKGGTFDGLCRFKNVKTFVHCIFNSYEPHGDFYTCISPWINIVCKTNIPVLPHIVYLPNIDQDLRMELKIPNNACVFGRYGGYGQFDVVECHNVIRRISQEHSNIYFIFMNTPEFCESSKNIIHLESSSDLDDKTKFINTCDAMIYGRSDGETFGLAIGEFSIRNKPIFAPTYTNNIYYAGMHKLILQDNAYWFENENDLYQKILYFDRNQIKLKNWNMYKEYTPEKVMKIFNDIIHSSHK